MSKRFYDSVMPSISYSESCNRTEVRTCLVISFGLLWVSRKLSKRRCQPGRPVSTLLRSLEWAVGVIPFVLICSGSEVFGVVLYAFE